MESKLPRNALYSLNDNAVFFLKQHFIAAEFWTQSSEHVCNIHSYSRKIVHSHPKFKLRFCIFIIYLWVRYKLKFRKSTSQSSDKAVTKKTWKKKLLYYCVIVLLFLSTKHYFLSTFCPPLEKHFEEHELIKLNTLISYSVIPTMYLKHAFTEFKAI